jgi:hypothetical protein
LTFKENGENEALNTVRKYKNAIQRRVHMKKYHTKCVFG